MGNESAESALVIQFAKVPEAGRVKTRLMPELGEQGALNAHVTLSLAVLNQLSSSQVDMRFYWDHEVARMPEAARPIISRIEALGITQGIQQGDVLGERMEVALSEALADYSKAMIVGSDCPSVDAAYIHQAVRLLDDVDVVLGPSDDGGYVLIGAKTHVPGMLENVSWGTDRALLETIARLDAIGLTCARLPARWDVDEPEDWQRFLCQFPELHPVR